ncbi:TPA: phage tail protein [Citrobacter amalonaticus]|nr:phage tail protein [Citrobacter amalonaticus]
MADLDNIFDAALSRADDVIRCAMGVEASVTSGEMAGQTIRGVFDDPESVAYAGSGVRVEGTSPSLFVETSSVSELRRHDTLVINGSSYWVDRIGPDDCGSCHVFFGKGSPPVSNRRH